MQDAPAPPSRLLGVRNKTHTAEEEAAIKEAWRRDPDRSKGGKDHQLGETTIISKPGLIVINRDMRTLLPKNWLNDTIINAHLDYLWIREGDTHCLGCEKSFFFSTHFHPDLRRCPEPNKRP